MSKHSTLSWGWESGWARLWAGGLQALHQARQRVLAFVLRLTHECIWHKVHFGKHEIHNQLGLCPSRGLLATAPL